MLHNFLQNQHSRKTRISFLYLAQINLLHLLELYNIVLFKVFSCLDDVSVSQQIWKIYEKTESEIDKMVAEWLS